MYENKTFLAIIPARSGSKRLPNKNILPLNGKPLIEYTINAAKKSRYIDEIVVNSDSDRILEIAKRNNVKTLKRPKDLAKDTSPTINTIIYTLKFYKGFDFVVLLQPTSPLREYRHIDEAIEFLLNKNADAVISVCEMEHPPLWSNTLPADLSMKNFLKKEVINKRSQDLPTYYRLNGAIYICRSEKLLREQTFFIEDKIFAYIMDKESSVDIDDEFDFKFAEFLLTKG